jgi:hypothetical protein
MQLLSFIIIALSLICQVAADDPNFHWGSVRDKAVRPTIDTVNKFQQGFTAASVPQVNISMAIVDALVTTKGSGVCDLQFDGCGKVTLENGTTQGLVSDVPHDLVLPARFKDIMVGNCFCSFWG